MNSVKFANIMSVPIASESQLDCLGFVVSNGRPRFKTDDPVIMRSTMSYNVGDEDDTLSFEILGKDSLHAIQELSYVSYVDIRQKSKSIDISSITSTLTANQIENKLTEVLQENLQLKEALKQNNIAMKQQFNMLAMWQEEVMKIQQSHKQKFAETKDFINHLKKECVELKMKLSLIHSSDTDNEFEVTDISGYNLSMTKDKLPARITDLGVVKQLLQDVQRYLILSEDRNTELRKATHMIQKQKLEIKRLIFNIGKNDESMLDESSTLNCTFGPTDIDAWIEQCLIKDKELNDLKGTILQLEQKLQCDLPIFPQLRQDLVSGSNVNGRQQFIENVRQCEENLQNLTDCFVTHISRSTFIQENIKKCIETLESCNLINSSELQLARETKHIKDKMSICHKNLIGDQVKIITDQQHLIKAVNEFKILFSKYNSVLYELEILQEENTKLKAMCTDSAREALEKIVQFEKSKNEELQLLQRQRNAIILEKQNLNAEKKSLVSKEKILDEERDSLECERQLLSQERINLYQEKASLDQQSQLYETHEKALQAEKKMLEKQHEKLLARINELEKDSQMIKALQKQIVNQSQDIDILRTHLSTYKEDFKLTKKSEDALLAEKLELTDQLRRQIQINKECEEIIQQLLALTGQPSSTNFQQHTLLTPQNADNVQHSTVSSYPVVIHHYSCPKCERTFPSIRLVEEHVEGCLNPQ